MQLRGFQETFFTVNENYLCAKMVDNDMFLRSAPGRRQQERGCIDRNLLGPDFYDGNKEMLQRINMNVLIQNGAVVSYQGLRASSGLNFSQAVCENIFTTYYNVRVNDLDRKKIFFTGIVDTLLNGDKTLYLLTATLINYTIWQWKLKKLIPSIASVKNDVVNSGIPICRRWRAGRYGRS